MKLKTVSEFARSVGRPTQTVRNWVGKGMPVTSKSPILIDPGQAKGWMSANIDPADPTRLGGQPSHRSKVEDAPASDAAPAAVEDSPASRRFLAGEASGDDLVQLATSGKLTRAQLETIKSAARTTAAIRAAQVESGELLNAEAVKLEWSLHTGRLNEGLNALPRRIGPLICVAMGIPRSRSGEFETIIAEQVDHLRGTLIDAVAEGVSDA